MAFVGNEAKDCLIDLMNNSNCCSGQSKLCVQNGNLTDNLKVSYFGLSMSIRLNSRMYDFVYPGNKIIPLLTFGLEGLVATREKQEAD